jgi:hypothetical protein
VVAALDDIALGREGFEDRLAVPFVIGPALWGTMTKLDPALDTLGTPSAALVPMPGGAQTWKMRSFLQRPNVVTIARHIKLRAVAEAFRGGTARPATQAERDLFYALTPLEIKDRPLTVLVVPPDHRLIVFVEDGRISWIDLISEYKVTAAK